MSPRRPSNSPRRVAPEGRSSLRLLNVPLRNLAHKRLVSSLSVGWLEFLFGQTLSGRSRHLKSLTPRPPLNMSWLSCVCRCPARQLSTWCTPWRHQLQLATGDIEPHPSPVRKRPAPQHDLLLADVMPQTATRHQHGLDFESIHFVKNIAAALSIVLLCRVSCSFSQRRSARFEFAFLRAWAHTLVSCRAQRVPHPCRTLSRLHTRLARACAPDRPQLPLLVETTSRRSGAALGRHPLQRARKSGLFVMDLPRSRCLVQPARIEELAGLATAFFAGALPDSHPPLRLGRGGGGGGSQWRVRSEDMKWFRDTEVYECVGWSTMCRPQQGNLRPARSLQPTRRTRVRLE